LTAAIIDIQPLGFQWPTSDPFLFCAFHNDAFPRGNTELGPDVSLSGRNIGQDFEIKDGWRMYHGDKIPGFPGHPHRGFETITIVPNGLVDHADSLGAAGRYGNGDVQWLTTGRGIQHSEMFPLLNQNDENPLLLFQLWLNLPAANKMVDPHFTMFWQEKIPVINTADALGNSIKIDVIAGDLQGVKALQPPPDSWAADPANGVAIWLIELAPTAQWTLPGAQADLNRQLFFFEGESLQLGDGYALAVSNGLTLRSEADLELKNSNSTAKLLLLQGKPIDEPVAQHGPFVMNTRQELQQAFTDYHKDQFGGWPWPRNDQVHGPQKGRFARYEDGEEETP
jgi:redox-sensitive bicupin YhaK (pirin superfamily)